jgi:hypothetical protein
MSIKTDCKQVFSLELIEFDILGFVAKSGEILRKNIHLASLSPKQTIRKIERLEVNGFLNVTNSKIYRNMAGKNIKTYGLTLKGLFASFAKTNLQDNYLVINYLSHIKDNKIKESIFNYIESDLHLFFLTNKNMGITLERMTNIELWVEDYDNLEKFLKKDIERVTRLTEKMDTAEKIILSSTISFEKKLEYLLTANYDGWYDVIDVLSKEKSERGIINQLEKKNKISSDKEFLNIGKDQFTNKTKNKKIMYAMWKDFEKLNSVKN